MAAQPEKASDQDMVDFLKGHIENPCSADVGGVQHHIRAFYLRELRRLLGTMTDAAARAQAEELLRQYPEE